MTQQAQNNNLIFLTGRCSFPNLVDPQVKTNDKGEQIASYNCDIILPPNDPGFQKFMQVYAALANEKWKENAQAAMQRIQMDRKTRCYGSGEEKVSSKTFQIHPGYAGMVFISARNGKQPQIINADGTQVDPTNTMQLRAVASKIYGGCWANIVVKPWLQQNAQGIGVRCDLVAVQFARDDAPFGSPPVDTTGMFGAVASAPQQFAPQIPPVAMPQMPFPAAGAPTPPQFAMSQQAPSIAQPMPAAPFGAPGVPNFMG